jgi:hypothetical protein
VTSQGSPYARFRRALLTKNPGIILQAAAELERVSLEDALKILVVLAEKRHDRFGHAAARFAAPVTVERTLDLAEARYVLALVEALPRSPDAVALLLRAYCA